MKNPPNPPSSTHPGSGWIARFLALLAAVATLLLPAASRAATTQISLSQNSMQQAACSGTFSLTISYLFSSPAPTMANTAVSWNYPGPQLTVTGIFVDPFCVTNVLAGFPPMPCYYLGYITVDVPCANLTVPS